MRALMGLSLLGVVVVMFWLWLEPATESARITGMAAAVPALPVADMPAAEQRPELPGPVQEPSTTTYPIPEVDYSFGVSGEDLPPERLEQVQAMYKESLLGNYDHAGHIALDLLEDVDQYPQHGPMLYSALGYCYEQLGYTEMAIEQYRLALAIFPEHRSSYRSMRRLNAEFARDNLPLPPLVKPPKKAVPQRQRPLTE
ncbi:hypothetical protein EYC98_09005 [Halieaceae bacterium IMCC14734]|uniref:Tetratricopeptide repeat protein n=1 Tax=Candidatus Litorirhabdus singularis TaxID=2518993 RepID=A0ABT3TGV9_9GAMM|nr:tetratricopeptide repeat protein [Candidatus Litorirhabdus singularis]MCX2981001.1 hypothetical protein [Candidatus Litorirhabdus singularis]